MLPSISPLSLFCPSSRENRSFRDTHVPDRREEERRVQGSFKLITAVCVNETVLAIQSSYRDGDIPKAAIT